MERERSRDLRRRSLTTEEDDEPSDEDEEVDSDEEEEKIKQSMLQEDKGEEFNSTQLRKYQLERLRYFYAILTFSSKDVAKHVYDLVDGAEYLSSANFSTFALSPMRRISPRTSRATSVNGFRTATSPMTS